MLYLIQHVLISLFLRLPHYSDFWLEHDKTQAIIKKIKTLQKVRKLV